MKMIGSVMQQHLQCMPVERKILSQEEFLEVLGVMDLVMEEPAKNVQKKAAWALRVVSKYHPMKPMISWFKWAENDKQSNKMDFEA
jgi:hypothetical protein